MFNGINVWLIAVSFSIKPSCIRKLRGHRYAGLRIRYVYIAFQRQAELCWLVGNCDVDVAFFTTRRILFQAIIVKEALTKETMCNLKLVNETAETDADLKMILDWSYTQQKTTKKSHLC